MKNIIKHFRVVLILFLLLPVFLNADGFLVIPEPVFSHQPFPLEVVYHRVKVDIEGQKATTSIEQSFYNPTNHQLEGFYIFPIPAGAVLNDFSMQINGRETPAELLDAQKARQIYEDIVRNMKDPALLEYSERGIFKVRIFPIEPRSEKKVSMSYNEIISEDSGVCEYVYPLNTEKFSAKPLQDVSISIDLKSDREIRNIYCPTHQVEIVRKEPGRIKISYEDMNVKPDLDFKLYFDYSNEKIGLSLLSYRESDQDGYFLASLSPAYEINKSEIAAKDIAFVLDVSGSMAGEKLRKAKSALIYCINNLNPDDHFEIIRFSTEAFAFGKKFTSVTAENLEQAEKFIEKLEPVGGTNIQEALVMALNYEFEQDRPGMIVFITDGKPTIGETSEGKLIDNLKTANKDNIRIFTFGIGNDINTHLLDKITEATRATRTYISPDEDIEMKITSFYDKVQSPVLTNLELIPAAGIELFHDYPADLPDLFRGSNLIIMGRYSGSGKTHLKLKGKKENKEIEMDFPVQFVKNEQKHDFIPPLWASRRIGYLLDLIRLHGESNELVEEITLLARKHGIVTPYTSYLIIEDEEVRVRSDESLPEFQTLGGNSYLGSGLGRSMKKEYRDLELKSGDRSVEVSREFESLQSAASFDQTRQGINRLEYLDEEGARENLINQVKNIRGRAFYQNGDIWVDSELQNQTKYSTQKIQFASKEYFKLLQNNRQAGEFLALGQQVRFFLDGVYYEIHE